MNALREPLPITFRITSFGGYVSVKTTILNPIEQQYGKRHDFLTEDFTTYFSEKQKSLRN